jgi:hypothetical protein
MGNWIERTPNIGETVRFSLDGFLTIGVFIKKGNGSSQTYRIVDIGYRRVWVWESATFEVWEYFH